MTEIDALATHSLPPVRTEAVRHRSRSPLGYSGHSLRRHDAQAASVLRHYVSLLLVHATQSIRVNPMSFATLKLSERSDQGVALSLLYDQTDNNFGKYRKSHLT
jgi:hypothetical protein